jgi:uncharacterized protein YkwD
MIWRGLFMLNQKFSRSLLLAIIPGLLLSQIYNSQVKGSIRIAQTPKSIAVQVPHRIQIKQIALQLVNRDRAQQGLAPLGYDLLLSGAAGLHALDMANRNYFEHYNFNGQGPTERFKALGGRGGVAENIIYTEIRGQYKQINVQLLEDFQQRWMNSSGHRKNLLNSQYTHFGYGIAVSPDGTRIYAVQTFSP